MELNRDTRLYFCTDYESEQPTWLLLSAGIIKRNVSRKSEKLAFYPVGNEANPQECVTSSVKTITLQGHKCGSDAAQAKLLSLHGERVTVLLWDKSKNGENKGKICEATVDVTDDGSGFADDPATIEVLLHCGAERETTVNETTFTA